ncbi:DUF2269 family protein [Paenibacillus sp. J22TS3]|uniref:DUF2269 family protein n=1 Tax=Paenibacillus sp. J22TS3 TaxID=2807192 RepID=UPI001B22B408|nr:DUF2269 family protein [Paenibacillus sp. J22TS3]GIP22158.1 hypothetical protein J22TS3_24330 [Paenibacillus sp. J22TS3]
MNVWLTLHLIGVLLMAGNIITAAFWKTRADLTGEPLVIHYAAKNVMMADYAFTIPGLVLIIASGSVMAGESGVSLIGINWLTVSLILLAVTGFIWLAILIPLQRKMIRISADCVEKGTISPVYRRASRSWAIYGTAATLLPIVILYLMVMKGF